VSAAPEPPNASAAAQRGRTLDGGTCPAGPPVPSAFDPPPALSAPTNVKSSTGWGADPCPERPPGADGTLDGAALAAFVDLTLAHRAMCDVLRSLGVWQRVIGPALTQHIGYHIRRAAESLEATFAFCSCHREKSARCKRCERCGFNHRPTAHHRSSSGAAGGAPSNGAPPGGSSSYGMAVRP
jgi:hypothetical protein